MHARLLPRAHRFAYRIFMVALDLDELDTLHRRLRLFSVNRANLFAFRETDHLPLSAPVHNPSRPTGQSNHNGYFAADLKARVLARLADDGIDPGPGARVELVTLPRMLGYLFNPVSFLFVRDAAGAPVAAIAEVTNTFREVKTYVLGPGTLHTAGGEAVFRLRTPKWFYVSPFSDVDVAFDFRLHAPDDRLAIRIDDHDGAERTLTSTLTGRARPLTDAALASCFFKYPLLTVRVIMLIHWHALRLFLKRIPWFPKAARAADQRDLRHPHHSLTGRTDTAEPAADRNPSHLSNQVTPRATP